MADYTMGTSGAAGVKLAIADSMKAAEMSRENEKLREVIKGYETDSCKLKKENADMRKEIEELREKCRQYRKDRAEGYAKAMIAQKAYNNERADRFNRGMAWFTAGMLLIIVLLGFVLKTFGA